MAKRFKKHFQLEEARALLPHLRRAFGHIHAARDQLLACEEQLAKTQAETGADLGGPAVNGLMRAMITIHEALNDITSRGIQVKDIDRGLVDFPHIRKGREVFLCWELEEDDIEFWHDLDTGYPGRERL
ncbi:MAG: DUF2203 domain-containing protein [Verrucomicrobiae bacterium]|nr:DUF2203 domain-containing protein [Verrucomicrobiae bacterium]